MSTIQIQKQNKHRQLTLDDIAPLWAEKIRSGNLERQTTPRLLDISNATCCIVGEAHNFPCDGLYRCPKCRELSCDLNFHRIEVGPETFNTALYEFVIHWNEVHVK